MELFDTHSHINSEQLRDRTVEILENANKFGVKYIACPGYDLESSEVAVKLADENKEIYALVGIHPEEVSKIQTEAKNEGKTFEEKADEYILEIEKLSQHPKVIAIGEIGLDHYWEKDKEIHKNQIILFKKQIKLANKLGLPISIHTRDATEDMIRTLQEEKCENTGIMHCCPFNQHLIKETLKLGYYISFAGVATFKNAKNADSSIMQVPENRILVETDAPYLTPEPNRGKENQPFNTYYVAEKVAKVKGIQIEKMAQILTENAKRIYKIES